MVDVLSSNTAIVDPARLPTREFMIKWAQLASTLGTIPDLSTAGDVSAILDLIGGVDGDMLVRGSFYWGALGLGASGQVLTATGGGPAWQTPSASGGAFTAVADEAIVAGAPAAISRITGNLIVARANTYVRSFVCGLAAADIAMGFAGDIETATLDLADWTAVTGATALLPGQNYFLSPTGGLQTTPLTTPGQYSIVAGRAISPTMLNIFPGQPLTL